MFMINLLLLFVLMTNHDVIAVFSPICFSLRYFPFFWNIQFNFFDLFLGTIVSAEQFEPKRGFIVQNKDQVRN